MRHMYSSQNVSDLHPVPWNVLSHVIRVNVMSHVICCKRVSQVYSTAYRMCRTVVSLIMIVIWHCSVKIESVCFEIYVKRLRSALSQKCHDCIWRENLWSDLTDCPSKTHHMWTGRALPPMSKWTKIVKIVIFIATCHAIAVCVCLLCMCQSRLGTTERTSWIGHQFCRLQCPFHRVWFVRCNGHVIVVFDAIRTHLHRSPNYIAIWL